MGISILKSELAGTWYTEKPEDLAHEIDKYLEIVEKKVDGHLIALLLPHAGYPHSGGVAAHGIKQLVGRSFSRVVVIGPSHSMALMDTVSIPDVNFIETPLGPLEVDRALASSLWEHEHFESHLQAHTHEHSVQVGLPMLQRALGHFKLVPIICGLLTESCVRRIATTLLKYIGSETLVVISTDFTHYGRAFDYVPFSDDIPENLASLDMGAFSQIAGKNLGGFFNYVHKTEVTICGRSAIAILISMLHENAKIHLLKYDTSGNITGDWSRSVSYISAAVTGQWQLPRTSGIQFKREIELLRADKTALLRFARHCITKRLRTTEPAFDLEITPPMQRIMGAFVTLLKNGLLRGYVGEIYPRRELCKAIAEQAVNAAFHDPHFPLLREDELDQIEIEISALSTPRSIDSYKDIEIGKHGIIISKSGSCAAFMPQVPAKQGWGLEETLTHLALKAGLSGSAWKSRCEYQVFDAIVFGESDGFD